MGKGRNWTAEDKAKIVLQGFKGRTVSEICNEYQIHQTQYYKWRAPVFREYSAGLSNQGAEQKRRTPGAADWLEAVKLAVNRQYRAGIREAENLELNLMSDNGSQPTSLTFMRECRALGINQTFTAYANREGNADTERLIRTLIRILKEELCWLCEWSSVKELAAEMEKFVEYFNESYLHSALGYKTPNDFENEWFENNQITRSATA